MCVYDRCRGDVVAKSVISMASPADLLRAALEKCLDGDPNVRKPAEELLRSNEKAKSLL